MSNRDIAISGAVLRLDSAGRVHVLLSCAPDAHSARCRGLVRIVGAERPFREVELGARRYNIPRGTRQEAFVKINRDARRAVAARGGLSVSARTSGPEQNRRRALLISAGISISDPGQPAPAVAGPAGPQGETGPAGPQGAPGPAGADGAPGATGAQGEVARGPSRSPRVVIGPAGPAGPAGRRRPRGAAGTSRSDRPAG